MKTIIVPRSEFAMARDSIMKASIRSTSAEKLAETEEAAGLVEMLLNLELCEAWHRRFTPNRVEAKVRTLAKHYAKTHKNPRLAAVAKHLSGQLLPTGHLHKHRSMFREKRLKIMNKPEWVVDGYPTHIELTYN